MSCSQNTITPRRPIGTDYRLDCIYLLYTRTRQACAAHIFTTQHHTHQVCIRQVVGEESPSSYLFQQSRRRLMKGWIGWSGTTPPKKARTVEVHDWLQEQALAWCQRSIDNDWNSAPSSPYPTSVFMV